MRIISVTLPEDFDGHGIVWMEIYDRVVISRVRSRESKQKVVHLL